jgi:carbohydrate-selective porin OprB
MRSSGSAVSWGSTGTTSPFRQGMLPGRELDRYGIGFYYANFSNKLPEIVLSGEEIGLEIFYNLAATHWLYVTPDIQVIEPAGNRATTAFLTGLRLQMRF